MPAQCYLMRALGVSIGTTRRVVYVPMCESTTHCDQDAQINSLPELIVLCSLTRPRDQVHTRPPQPGLSAVLCQISSLSKYSLQPLVKNGSSTDSLRHICVRIVTPEDNWQQTDLFAWDKGDL